MLPVVGSRNKKIIMNIFSIVMIWVSLFAVFVMATNKNTPQFIPEDSMEYFLPQPDSSITLSVVKSLSPLTGVIKNQTEYQRRLNSGFDILSSESQMILQYKIDGKIINDSLFGYNSYLDTLLKLLDSIPNGRYKKEVLDPYEITLQSKTKYISCVACLLNSEGLIFDKFNKLFRILNMLQEKACKRNW
jgi:hypothetical protein